MLLALRGRNFRNLEALDWHPTAQANLLLGGNGAGKTNLLEAIYLLATTRSFRTAQLADCCRHGAAEFWLAGEVVQRAQITLALTWTPAGRQRSLDERGDAPLEEHVAALPVLAWTSAESELLQGVPAVRRRFLDRGLVALTPRALAQLGRYQQVLRQKRQLLAGGLSGVEPWNELLAQAAHVVARERAQLVASLSRTLTALAAACGQELAPIELRYRPSPEGAAEDLAATRAAIAASSAEERRRHLPLVGSHRDELVVLLGGREARRVASAGESKAVGLLLIASLAALLGEAGRRALLLLDDCDAELDRRRLEGLWPALVAGGQILATSNRPEVWEGVTEPARWQVFRGEIAAF